MKREWKKYHNQQKYSECQLVAALNMYYYFTGKHIKQDSKRYENLVDLCKARWGSALSIEEVWRKLKIRPHFATSNYQSVVNTDKFRLPLPLELCVWHKKTGFHSVVIVGYEPRTRCVRIPNFQCATNMDGWMFYEDLYQYVIDNPDKALPRWQARIFTYDGKI